MAGYQNETFTVSDVDGGVLGLTLVTVQVPLLASGVATFDECDPCPAGVLCSGSAFTPCERGAYCEAVGF
jgi:hypothetical protein